MPLSLEPLFTRPNRSSFMFFTKASLSDGIIASFKIFDLKRLAILLSVTLLGINISFNWKPGMKYCYAPENSHEGT